MQAGRHLEALHLERSVNILPTGSVVPAHVPARILSVFLSVCPVIALDLLGTGTHQQNITLGIALQGCLSCMCAYRWMAIRC